MGESDEKKFSLIHIDAGDWSKPVNTLIEKCAEGIAAIARPMQIRRIAEAEVEAEKIHAVAQIEIDRIQRRALTRFIAEETKRQHNMESILAKALPEVRESAKPEQVEDDWIANFFDKSRLISDEQMQTLWARVLAGEANSPGKFSKRTVGLLASMDKSDAIMFSKLCRFVCSIPDHGLNPIIYGYKHPLYERNGIDFPLLSHLENIGLTRLSTDPITCFAINGLGQTIVVDYFGQKIPITFAHPQNIELGHNELAIGAAMFTQAGQQLAAICDAEPLPEFFEFLKKSWLPYISPAEGS